MIFVCISRLEFQIFVVGFILLTVLFYKKKVSCPFIGISYWYIWVMCFSRSVFFLLQTFSDSSVNFQFFYFQISFKTFTKTVSISDSFPEKSSYFYWLHFRSHLQACQYFHTNPRQLAPHRNFVCSPSWQPEEVGTHPNPRQIDRTVVLSSSEVGSYLRTCRVGLNEKWIPVPCATPPPPRAQAPRGCLRFTSHMSHVTKGGPAQGRGGTISRSQRDRNSCQEEASERNSGLSRKVGAS